MLGTSMVGLSNDSVIRTDSENGQPFSPKASYIYTPVSLTTTDWSRSVSPSGVSQKNELGGNPSKVLVKLTSGWAHDITLVPPRVILGMSPSCLTSNVKSSVHRFSIFTTVIATSPMASTVTDVSVCAMI